jgi:hypothetical protein
LVFDILNIFQSCWFIDHKDLIANILLAMRDADGQFTWVDFLPAFHIFLVKTICTLLLPSFIVAHSKWVLFVFLLEILTGDKGLKPEVFWHACKKHSQASQKVCPATLTLISAPLAPSPMLTISLMPCAQSTSMVAPVPKVVLPTREDDMSMGLCPVMLTPSLAAPSPLAIQTNANFIKSFSQDLNLSRPLKAWIGKAAYYKLP